MDEACQTVVERLLPSLPVVEKVNVCLYACLSLSVCLSVYLSVVCLSVSFLLSICMSLPVFLWGKTISQPEKCIWYLKTIPNSVGFQISCAVCVCH